MIDGIYFFSINAMTKFLQALGALIIWGFMINVPLKAQSYKTLADKIHSHQEEHPVEKVFLHTDKQIYSAGENIWYKAYIFNPETRLPESKSGLLYVELLSENETGIVQNKSRIVYAGASGDFSLPEDLQAGNYRLVAYTNLMKNYGEAYYFQQNIQVVNPHFEQLHIQYEQEFDQNARTVNLKLSGDHFSGEHGTSTYYYRLRNGEKDFKKGKVKVDPQGQVALTFDPTKIADDNLLLELAYEVEGKTIIREIGLGKQQEDYQLEFYPEGGDMIAGQSGRIAFRLIDSNGKPMEMAGEVLDDAGEVVANFQSLHEGLGMFHMKPILGEKYRIRAKSGDRIIEKPLPKVLSEGLALNLQMNKSAFATLRLSGKDFGGQEFYILIQDGQNIEKLVSISWPVDRDYYLMKLPLEQLSSGVKRLTIFDEQLRPHCERLFFVNHHQEEAAITFEVNETFGNRELVAPKITVQDSLGDPLAGHFSVAVVDKTAVSENMDHDITSYLLLNADLENAPEKSVPYLAGANSKNPYLVDMVMMTNGWRRFSWRDVFEASENSYAIEKGIILKGHLEGAFGKNQKGGRLILANAHNLLEFTMTETDENGDFVFENLNVQDTSQLVLQGRKRRGSSHVVVSVDTVPHYSSLYPAKMEMASEGIAAYISRRDEIFKFDTLYNVGFDVKMLEEFVVSDTRLEDEEMSDLNSTWFTNYDKTLEAEAITQYPSIENMLQQMLPASRQAINEESGTTDLIYRNQALAFTLDGMLVSYDDILMLSPIDVKQVFFASDASVSGSGGMGIVAFHTISGTGGTSGETSLGLNILTNIGYHSPREFPKMNYSEKQPEHIKPDHRTTVHWQPWVITDQAGKAKFEFYTSDDRKTEYEIRLQGVTAGGLLINATKRIQIQ
ncbi:hypothetical protein PEDI_40540 [Persicobacter diffluens]|uniref:Macroglobulin domain-containing protein n=2 Tax=Persicobacter diffluens TaxID=981 RepID=A0AAN4W1S9_9BACT|nr:hypothetical protein PEDI_40540 [Persicobacter diffluens]